MKRSIWTECVYGTSCPAWTCPTCQRGSLVLVQGSLTSHESPGSLRAHNDPDWDPDWTEYSFTAWAKCTHARCAQIVAISGSGGVEGFMRENGDYDWPDTFHPKICTPMPDMIEIPPKCPDDVSKELREAFSVYWISSAACAGRIRVALECLMDHLGVPRKRKNANRRYRDLTLHGRIDLYTQSNPAAGGQLMALKWLGNAGSHSSTVSTNDLLDAFEILEHVLAELIDRRSAKVATLARQLTRKHGARS